MQSKPFSHIYIEERILDLPRTIKILERFPKAERIIVSHYKNVFNVKSQNFRLQKSSPKLILAKKEDSFLYPGSFFSPSFGQEHFYYNTLVLNCLYDCEYCYLQGMYSSGNIVVFVNLEDFFSAVETFLSQAHSLYLCISYDTDLLALEGTLGFCEEWIQFCKRFPQLTIELRTKSANFSRISHFPPFPNFILAWTIGPNYVQKTWESKTPSWELRKRDIQKALEKGWKVRLCIDPLLRYPGWETDYQAFVADLCQAIDLSQVTEVCLGVFRINSNYLKKMRRELPESSLLWYPFPIENELATYPKPKETEIKEKVAQWILEKQPQTKLVFH